MKGRPDLVEKQDLKYVNVDPDPDFDAKRNESIIEATVKATDKLILQKRREAMEKVGERISAVGTYVQGISQGRTSTNRERFFGKKYLAYLRGYEIMEKIKGELMLRGRDDKLFVIKPTERARKIARNALSR